MANRKLELEACRIFVCPNLSLIDQKGKELEMMDDTIEKAKNMAIEYFKKTYHRPKYTAVKYLMPSFLYLASIAAERVGSKDRKTQEDMSRVFGIGIPTIKRWNKDIINTLGLRISAYGIERIVEE